MAKKHGVSLAGQRARQVDPEDIKKFDLIVAMDSQNKSDLEGLFGASEKIVLLRDYDEQADSLDVPDPYFGGPEGFEVVYDMVYRSCNVLLDDLCDS